jgi:peptidoglycan/LPS O-acetylase OafA/YrhL
LRTGLFTINSKKNLKEIRAITGMRAVAAYGVYCTHFGLPEYSPHWLANIVPNGGLGVPFFFVLSGFVLTIAYENRPLESIQFAIDRFARIGPTYYFAFCLAFLYASITNDAAIDYVFFAHLLGLQSWFPTMDSGVSFNGPAWTISVEIFLYSMFPFLLKFAISQKNLLKKWYSVLICGLLISLIPFGIHLYFLHPMQGLHNTQVWTYLLPVHYLGLFVIGIGGCLARFTINNFLRNRIFHSLICDVSIFLYLLILTQVNLKDPSHPLLAKMVQFWLIGIPTIWILVLVSTGSNKSIFIRLFETKLFWFAGKISMVFYLLHVPIVWWIQRIVPNSSYEVKLLVTLIASILTHWLIEDPLNSAIRKRYKLMASRN